MAQKYRQPIWKIPTLLDLAPEDRSTISGNREMYLEKQDLYLSFAKDLMSRLQGLED